MGGLEMTTAGPNPAAIMVLIAAGLAAVGIGATGRNRATQADLDRALSNVKDFVEKLSAPPASPSAPTTAAASLAILTAITTTEQAKKAQSQIRRIDEYLKTNHPKGGPCGDLYRAYVTAKRALIDALAGFISHQLGPGGTPNRTALQRIAKNRGVYAEALKTLAKCLGITIQQMLGK